MNVIQF